MGLGSWIVKKGIWYVACALGVLGVGSFLGILPDSVKGFMAWLDANTTMLLAALIILAVCYTAVRISNRKKGSE
jgi:hypothetical protein